VLALALAIVGIYGVTSYVVAGRTREIGIRIALGARPSAVVSSVLMQGLRPVVLGLVFGLVAAALAGLAIRATLYGVPPLAPVVFVTVAALLGTAGTLACYVPARRAGQVDPAVTLRWE
jgi:ABC-type antimicrobial peptide transport system permease subunit